VRLSLYNPAPTQKKNSLFREHGTITGNISGGKPLARGVSFSYQLIRIVRTGSGKLLHASGSRNASQNQRSIDVGRRLGGHRFHP